ncbi:DDB1- and CUL4-associated factor 13 [Halotydeus destructor]|nr:DDB1- and CUL4-associated factor 13 [Halotydeus destructor]
MKVKMICRNPSEYMRETKFDIHKVPRNYDPKLHPFEVAREYQRALNAVKLDKIFAKPFVGSLEGHSDVVQCMIKHPVSLSTLISGSCDGEIKLWNLPTKRCVRTIPAYNGIVRGLAMARHGQYFFSVDNQSSIKQWRTSNWTVTSTEEDDDREDGTIEDASVPMNTIIGKYASMSIAHHYEKPLLATCGERVEIWEETRSDPIVSYLWGADTVNCIKFNPVETDILASAASDRSITLYDIRKPQPLRKIVLKLRTNSLAWNPMEAFHFTAANEDYDLYTFDMRKLSVPIQIHKDHVSAVIDVDYSPTGKEFVSGSYDKTLRIFAVNQGRSREVYHTKRMQRLTTVQWSGDSKYVLCGSDEMDIRIWKANASEKLGFKMHREEANFRYQAKLKQKFAHYPQIKRIARHKHVPKAILHAGREKQAIVDSKKRKEANRRAHSKAGSIPYVSERVRSIAREDE